MENQVPIIRRYLELRHHLPTRFDVLGNADVWQNNLRNFPKAVACASVASILEIASCAT